MALLDFTFFPGIDKQNTAVGAEQRWIDCDNVRFRYLLPEKVGGWSSLITDTICGVARRQFAFVDLDGNRYVAIGTDKFLLLYFEGQLYDITPVMTALTGATIATASGVRINLATGTVSVISWNPIVPGATGTWIPIDPNNP